MLESNQLLFEYTQTMEFFDLLSPALAYQTSSINKYTKEHSKKMGMQCGVKHRQNSIPMWLHHRDFEAQVSYLPCMFRSGSLPFVIRAGWVFFFGFVGAWSLALSFLVAVFISCKNEEKPALLFLSVKLFFFLTTYVNELAIGLSILKVVFKV